MRSKSAEFGHGPSSSPDFLQRHWRPCDDTVAIWRMLPASSCIRAVRSDNKSIGKLAEFASRSAARFRLADRFRCGIHVGPYLHSRVIVFSRWSIPFARLDAVSSFELWPSRINCTSENGSFSFSYFYASSCSSNGERRCRQVTWHFFPEMFVYAAQLFRQYVYTVSIKK